MMPISVWLCLLLASRDIITTDASRHVMYPGYGGQVGNVNAMDQQSTLICHSAGCTKYDGIRINNTQPTCGSQATCRSCPLPATTSSNICYLSRADPSNVNVAEGSLFTSNKISHTTASESGEDGYKDEDDENEDESFLQIETSTLQLKPSTTDAEIKSNVASCSKDAHNTVDVTIRVIVQWYKSPHKKSSADGKTALEAESMLDLSPLSEVSIGDTVSHWDAHRPSFLEILPKLTKKLKGLFSSNSDEDGVDEKNEDEMGSLDKATGAAIYKTGKDIFKFAKKKLTVPRLTVNFSVHDHTIVHCRQTQRWTGKMNDKSILFTAVQNVKLNASQLNAEFLKKAIQVDVTCKDCESVNYVSCVQVLCPKRQHLQRNLGLYHNSVVQNYGIMQPNVHLPSSLSEFVGHPAAPVSSASAPRVVYNPQTMMIGYMNHKNNSDGMYVHSYMAATVAMLLISLWI